MRNTIKYVTFKDSREVVSDAKSIYRAASKEIAEENLEAFEQKWSKRYPTVTRSWRNNWSKLSTFFKYPPEIRRVIYTTNAIEGYHRQLRKATKTKGVFPSDMGLIKLIYLATEQIEKKWKRPFKEWAITAQLLVIIFGDRMKLDI